MNTLRIIIAGATLLLAACAPAAPAVPTQPPAPKPTAAPAAVAPAPTAAPAAKPTQAPAATPATTPSFPQRGKPITLIAPFAAGGSLDVHARMLAPIMEAELGVPVQVVNRPGAASQVGLTELAKAPPDGHTLLMAALPGALPTYLDETRGAAYGRKDLRPIANQVADPEAIAVGKDSPYQTLAQLVDAAKAKPNEIKVGTSGLLGTDHLAILLFEKMTGAKFSVTHFEGSGPSSTALLGGHIDVVFGNRSNYVSFFKSGEVRLLAVMDAEESSMFPGVKTAASQGYAISFAASRGIIAPAGTPAEVVDILARTVKKASETPDFKAKLEASGVKLTYMDPSQYAAYWDQEETQTKELLKMAGL